MDSKEYINDDWNEADELEFATEGDGSDSTAEGEERFEHFAITVDK